MPYENVDELPAAVKDNLPSGAQTIYMNAYNSADEEHTDWDEGEKAQYAWGAVKKSYEKKDDKWVKKEMSKLSYKITNDEFTLDMPSDLAGWARVFFQIPPEAWEEMTSQQRDDLIATMPIKLQSIAGKIQELETLRLSWAGTETGEQLEWMQDDIWRLWDELWDHKEMNELKADALDKRIDDLIAIISGIRKLRRFEREQNPLESSGGNSLPPTAKKLKGFSVQNEEPLLWHRQGSVLKIDGTLIAEGVWTGMDGETVFYPRTIFPYAASSIVGARIKRGHNDTDQAVIGFVTAASAVEDRIQIEGVIYDPDAVSDVALGGLSGISMEAEVHAEWSEEKGCWFATEMNLLMATLVEYPACDTCNVNNMVSVALQKGTDITERKRKNMSAELSLLENPLFKDVVATLTEAEVPDSVVVKVLETLRKAVTAQSATKLAEEIENLKEQILAKDKDIEDKHEELTQKDTEKTEELGKKDVEIESLKTKNGLLEADITAIRQAEVNVLLAKIKEIDAEFDEKELLEGVDNLCTQKTLLGKVLTSVVKLSGKTEFNVNTNSHVESVASTFLAKEMGIFDVKKFVEG